MEFGGSMPAGPQVQWLTEQISSHQVARLTSPPPAWPLPMPPALGVTADGSLFAGWLLDLNSPWVPKKCRVLFFGCCSWRYCCSHDASNLRVSGCSDWAIRPLKTLAIAFFIFNFRGIWDWVYLASLSINNKILSTGLLTQFEVYL